MAGSRMPGPLGMSGDAEESQGLESGVLGASAQPGPIGNEGIPLDAPAPAAPKAADTGVELNLVANYPKPASWTLAKEKELIGANTWFPHSLDFQAVAGKGSQVISSPEDFLLKIIQTKGSINRLNFFSHGVTGKIAMSGTMDPNGQFVTLDTGWTGVIGAKRIADPYAKTWGDSGEDSGSVKIQVGGTSFSLDDVRAKFTSTAEIWLYICHGGTDPMLLQNISNTFQATVKGFTKIIVYCAPQNFPTSRNHKVATKTTEKASDSCPSAVSDFHQLTVNVTAASPKKP